MKKTAALSADLIAKKGAATPVTDMPTRSQAPTSRKKKSGAPEKVDDIDTKKEAGLTPLNFRVTASFRREYKTYAAAHDLKLNELLRRAFDAYRRTQGD